MCVRAGGRLGSQHETSAADKDVQSRTELDSFSQAKGLQRFTAALPRHLPALTLTFCSEEWW